MDTNEFREFKRECESARASFHTERYKSLRIHTQRFACLTLCGSIKINDSKGKYAIYCDAVYKRRNFGITAEKMGR